ncbi:hypothetical protein ACFYOK_29450 [Microbispora bryophytorum]|uniref:hypothetical protein n=1 Tax=Microbispora bryophytorum TaxID=1460882 RepID=UPI0033F559BF
MSEPRIAVVTIEWGEGEGEVFGPWAVHEDGAHLEEIRDFVQRWHAREDKPNVNVTLAVVTSPDAYDERTAGT